ncbi:MAG: FtsH protease activity modulator HflK [Gammaproteobacteria bacterium]|nr:FtsH protease activity modulator HflK [Gammaproteobacteria bacterium]
MAWNQPGGNGNNQDPWGKKRPNNQNDLDKMIKEAGDKFGKMFGGKGGKGANSGKSFFFIGLLVFAAFYAIKGFYTVKEAEQGVITRFGAYHHTVGPGLGWMPPFIDRLYKVDVNTQQQKEISGNILTKDKNIVDVDFTIVYRVDIPEDYLFNVFEQEKTIEQVAEAAIRQVVGQSVIDDVLKDNKTRIMQDTMTEMERILAPYKMGVEIYEVNMADSKPPIQVRPAFDDVTSSLSDEKRYVQEAKAYQNDKLPKAEGQAARIIKNAEAYKSQVVEKAKGEVARFQKLLPEYELAPEVTRQRLYLETVEEVMSNVSKVVIDTEGGSNLTYLPLDQIVNKKKATQKENN